MARGRMISKSLSTSEKYAALHEADPGLAEFCQSLFPLLVAHADDFGRLAGDPFSVRLSIMPTSPRVITEFGSALALLDRVGLIRLYEAGGRKFIQIQKFEDHQTGLHKRTRSHFPDPPTDSGKSLENPSEQEQEREQEENRKKDHRSLVSSKAVAGGFDVFWQEYPRKDAKEAARQVWNRLAPDAALLTRILAAVRTKCAGEWRQREVKYIPHARTWLNQQRWTDEGEVSAIARPPAACSRGHNPPCADESICSERYRAELRRDRERVHA